MSFALLKKWSQLTHHYPQFPEGMELIGVYGDDGGKPNEDGIAKIEEILGSLDAVGFDEGRNWYYKAGNPDDTFSMNEDEFELEWDLGDFVLAFEDLLEEFEGYPEQLQLDILKEKYGYGDLESEQVLALLSIAGFRYIEDVEKDGDGTYILPDNLSGSDQFLFLMKTKIELHTFATFDEAIFQMNLGEAFLENEGKSASEVFNDTSSSLDDNMKSFDDFIDFLNSSGNFKLRWGVLKTGHFFVIDLEEKSEESGEDL